VFTYDDGEIGSLVATSENRKEAEQSVLDQPGSYVTAKLLAPFNVEPPAVRQSNVLRRGQSFNPKPRSGGAGDEG